MEIVRLYVRRSTACTSIQNKRFYVLENHTLFKSDDGVHIISNNQLVYDPHLNQVDGFLAWCKDKRRPYTYCFMDEISVTELKKIRKRIQQLSK